MSNTNARTVTNAAKKAIRLAGLKDVVVKVNTHDNGDGTFTTHVETIHDRSKATQEKVVTALKAERFAVEGVTTEAARFAFRPLTEAEAVTVALIKGDQDAVDEIATKTRQRVAKAAVEPTVIGEMVVGKGRSATTVAQLVSDFRAEGAKGRRANAEGNHDIVPTTLANRIDMGELLVKVHLVGLTRALFAEQQDLLTLHPATKADPATRTAAQERLSVVRHNIAGLPDLPAGRDRPAGRLATRAGVSTRRPPPFREEHTVSVEGYYPTSSEQDADSTRAELGYLRGELESLLAKPPTTTAEILEVVRQALYSAEQVGIDVFQYR